MGEGVELIAEVAPGKAQCVGASRKEVAPEEKQAERQQENDVDQIAGVPVGRVQLHDV